MNWIPTFENFNIHKSIDPDAKIIMSADERITPYSVQQKPKKYSFKPEGLWYGIGSSWLDWVDANMPSWRQKYIHELHLNMSKILQVNKDMSFREFEDKYGVGFYKTGNRQVVSDIDWVAVQKDGWYGVEIMSPWGVFGSWLNPWDASSGCVWDKRAIQKIELIEP
jgi:hypothetical protein